MRRRADVAADVSEFWPRHASIAFVRHSHASRQGEPVRPFRHTNFPFLSARTTGGFAVGSRNLFRIPTCTVFPLADLGLALNFCGLLFISIAFASCADGEILLSRPLSLLRSSLRRRNFRVAFLPCSRRLDQKPILCDRSMGIT